MQCPSEQLLCQPHGFICTPLRYSFPEGIGHMFRVPISFDDNTETTACTRLMDCFWYSDPPSNFCWLLRRLKVTLHLIRRLKWIQFTLKYRRYTQNHSIRFAMKTSALPIATHLFLQYAGWIEEKTHTAKIIFFQLIINMHLRVFVL